MSGPDVSKLIYLLIIGGFAGCIGFFSLRSLVALARLSGQRPSTGRIVRKRIDSDDGTFYYVTYAFEDSAGGQHQKEVQLRKANFDRLQEGQTASVVYQPGNPRNSYLGDLHFRRSHLLATCLWLLLAALLVYVAYQFVTQCVLLNICPS